MRNSALNKFLFNVLGGNVNLLCNEFHSSTMPWEMHKVFPSTTGWFLELLESAASWFA